MISIITGLFGIGKALIQNKTEEVKEKHLTKREEVQAKREANQQKEQNLSQGEQSMTSLDAITLKQIGWLDDFVVIVTMLSILLNFIPFSADYMSDGFDALDNAPEWYQYAVASVYIYVLGFKSLIYRLLVKRGGDGIDRTFHVIKRNGVLSLFSRVNGVLMEAR